jgi:general L-amino acid transport system substrate-binding protein
MKISNVFKIFASLLLVTFGSNAIADTLSDTKERGHVRCGVSQGLPGFSNPDADGNWSGIDVDVCRAVAAAIFGDASKVEYFPTSAKERFTKLTAGEYDILSRNTTWTLSRDAKIGLTFNGVNFYDGQGFMVPKSLGITSALELDGASVCVNTGTTTELNLADYFRANGMSYEPVVFEKADEVLAAYDSGRCDVHTTDKSGLAAQRTKLAQPNDHMVLGETISKEPLGPVTREGDEPWSDIVFWVLNALITADELGVTSSDVEGVRSDPDSTPEWKRILGTEGATGEHLGLGAKWAYNAIQQVGNYGEMYERHVGANSPLALARDGSPNAGWKNGGLLYAPPIR